jgi:putative ABC transport system permease protein
MPEWIAAMPDPRSINRSMFWRIIRRLLGANRGRLLVILLTLGSGAAVNAALLNLQVDARRRLTTEFRTLGANVIVAPRDVVSRSAASLEESVLNRIPHTLEGQHVSAVAFLYLVGDAYAYDSNNPSHVVIAGHQGDFSGASPSDPPALASGSISRFATNCHVGARVAREMRLHPNDRLFLRSQGREETCHVASIEATGGSEDNQISVRLDAAQRLAALPGHISLVQISVPGTPRAIGSYITELAQRLPDAEVHGIRQFTDAEARIYDRISGLLQATVALVLILTALCVMAAMTNVAMERKNDVGLMKAIGGATRRVLRLFLAEAAVLGVIGGGFGAALGMALSIWLGKAVFGVAARPRLIVYPVAVALTILVAIAGAYPLRRLASIRPASVFRGEA